LYCSGNKFNLQKVRRNENVYCN